jgi:hypothetical protein
VENVTIAVGVGHSRRDRGHIIMAMATCDGIGARDIIPTIYNGLN